MNNILMQLVMNNILMHDNLEELKAYLKRTTSPSLHVLQNACFNNSKKCLEWMLANFNFPDKTYLFQSALYNRQSDVVTFLFKYKSQINFTYVNDNGYSLMYYATYHPIILKRIINEGGTLSSFSSDEVCNKCFNDDSIIMLLQHNLIHNTKLIPLLHNRVLKSKQACVSATIALLHILRVNRIPQGFGAAYCTIILYEE